MKKIFLMLLSLVAVVLHAQKKADLIVCNGKIATMEKKGDFVQAMAIKDGIILDTGTTKNILSSYKATTNTAY